jgi:hypothetical protein
MERARSELAVGIYGRFAMHCHCLTPRPTLLLPPWGKILTSNLSGCVRVRWWLQSRVDVVPGPGEFTPISRASGTCEPHSHHHQHLFAATNLQPTLPHHRTMPL